MQLVVVSDPGCSIDESWVGPQVVAVDGGGQAGPELGRRREVDDERPAIASRERVGLGDARPRGPRRDRVVVEVARGVLADERGRGLEQGGLHAPTGARPGHAPASAARTPTTAMIPVMWSESEMPIGRGSSRSVKQPEQAADGLPHGVVARPVAVRPARPEARDGADDQAWVGRPERCLAQTEAVEGSRPQVFSSNSTLRPCWARRVETDRRPVPRR